MAELPLLTAKNLQLGFGGRPLFANIDVAIGPRERLCLVGRNGSGKSTLMKVLAGATEPDTGKVDVLPRKVVTYLPQEPDFSGFASVRDALMDALHDEHGMDYMIEPMAEDLKLDLDAAPAVLSGGGKRRIALARAFLTEPDLLLIDEPTNHLDIPAVDWVEEQLKSFRGAWVLISHDRRLLEETTNSTLWLDRGNLHRHSKGFKDFEAFEAHVMNEEARDIAREKQYIKAEMRYMERGVTARRTRNEGRVRKLAKLREQARERIAPTGKVKLDIGPSTGSGKLAIEAKNISKAFGDKIIATDVSTRIQAGDKVGLIGPNGVGKTTLINMLLGTLEPDSGSVRHGTRLETIFVDQSRSELDPSKTIQDILAFGSDYVDVRGEKRHITSYLKDYLFDPSQMRSPVSSLSGGERGRLLLAQAFAKPANMIVLDEPTNDLDLDTLELLEDVLADSDATIIIVSHDRSFIDSVATSTLVPMGGGTWREYPGGYSDFIAQVGTPPWSTTEIEAIPKASVAPIKTAPSSKSGGKLTYKDQHRLDRLPAEIEGLEGDIMQLTARLDDPQLYAKSPDEFARLTKQLEAKQTALAKAEEDWVALEEKREALAGG